MPLPAKKLAEAKLVLDRERPELDPSLSKDRKLYVEREVETHQALITEALSAIESKRPFRWFLTGHYGAGKSTELNLIIRSEALTDSYVPNIFRVREHLDPDNLDFADLILGIGMSVATLAKEHNVPVSQALQKRIEKWGTETELETQLGTTSGKKGGFGFHSLVFRAGAEIQAGSQKRTIVREKMRESITDFVKLIDDLVAAIERKVKKKVLVVIDTLDHCALQPVRDIFNNYWASLSRPHVSLLIVVPLPMLLEQQFMGSVQKNVSMLPNISVFEGPRSAELDKEGFAFFLNVVRKLADVALFTDNALKELFRLSGGMLRDMIGLAGEACTYADIDGAEVVTEKHVQRVLDDNIAWFRRLLTSADYEELRKLQNNPYPMGIEKLGPLLHLKAVINYPNGEGWYGLNAAVQSILDSAGD